MSEQADRDEVLAAILRKVDEIERSVSREITVRMPPAAGESPTKTETFRLEWYKLSRAHELELNKATLQYEHERLKFIAYLNGGAATAFLTFVATVWKDSFDRLPFILAIGCWGAGLWLAWAAWTKAYRGQQEYSRATRYRRHIEEQAHLALEFPNGSALNRYGVPVGEDLAMEATNKGAGAKSKMERAWSWANASVVAFTLGIGAAAWSLYGGAEPSQAANLTLSATGDEATMRELHRLLATQLPTASYNIALTVPGAPVEGVSGGQRPQRPPAKGAKGAAEPKGSAAK